MGLKLSRTIRKIRNKILYKIKDINLPTYYFFRFIGALFKFIYSINKKKKNIHFSKKIDEINKFEYKITSQNNEDGIIQHIFKKINLEKINFVEIGFDYYENNSINFFKNVNKGVLIDSSEEKVKILNFLVKLIYRNNKITVLKNFVTKSNINQIISEKFDNSDDIDFLSLDLDGIDYYVLEELKIRPKFLCLEYNFWYGNSVKCSVPYSHSFRWQMGSTYSGASIAAISELAKNKGYSLIALESASVNAFFVRNDLKKNFKTLDYRSSFSYPSKYNLKEIEKAQTELFKKKLNYF